MNNIELYLNDNLVDLADDVKFILDKTVSEFRDPLKATSTISQPITLLYTARNKEVLFNENDRQVLGKFRRTYTARLIKDGQQLVSGEFLHLANTSKGFEGAIGVKGEGAGTIKLGDLLKGKKLTEIKSLTAVDFNGHETVAESWENVVSYPDSEICFPWVLRSLAQLKTGFISHYEDLGISHFAAAVLRAIFIDAGYEVNGDIFSNPTFQKLILLYSSTAAQAWNYGKLLPLKSKHIDNVPGSNFESVTIKKIERDNDTVFVQSFPFIPFEGDKAGCLQDGVYTAKFTGIYNINAYAVSGAELGGIFVNTDDFSVIRCINNSETIPDNRLPPAGTFSTVTALQLDTDTLLAAAYNLEGNIRLEADKQYVIQRYISVSKNINTTNNFRIKVSTNATFNINSVNGPDKINPALFLPAMTQAEFVSTIFKKFNLFYQVNTEQKIVTLLTRDDFFQETISDIVDMNGFLDIDSMNESPLTEKEIGKTYMSYITDDSDFILKQTDYLETVNGLQPEESTKIPFAPMTFLRVKYDAGVYSDYDLIPAIIPYTESEDVSVIDDTDSFSVGGAWVPRLALYNGNGWFTNNIGAITYVSLGRYILFPDFFGNGASGLYEFSARPPKLSFFDYSSQPGYEIIENTQLRSFSLEKIIGSNMYTNKNTFLLADIDRIIELDTVSLAPNISAVENPKGFFFQLYANDLLINSLSNYLEGSGRMDETLFQKLTGRQILRLNNDLFLLESIKNFDINRNSAQYKIYKLIANSGQTGTTLINHRATKEYTAYCLEGYEGSPVTKSATRTSFTSLLDAELKALAAAKQLAEFALQCTLIYVEPETYTSTQYATEYCPSGYEGPPSVGEGTYTSYISQEDADTEAMILAVLNAQQNLDCRVEEF